MPFLPPNQHRQSTEGIVVRMRQFATYDGRTWHNLCECWVCLHGTFIHTHMQRVVGSLIATTLHAVKEFMKIS